MILNQLEKYILTVYIQITWMTLQRSMWSSPYKYRRKKYILTNYYFIKAKYYHIPSNSYEVIEKREMITYEIREDSL